MTKSRELLVIKQADFTPLRYIDKLGDHLLDEVSQWPEKQKSAHVKNEKVEIVPSIYGFPPENAGLREFLERARSRSIGTPYDKTVAQFIISHPPDRMPLTEAQECRVIEKLKKELGLENQPHIYVKHHKDRNGPPTDDTPVHGHLLVDLLNENRKPIKLSHSKKKSRSASSHASMKNSVSPPVLPKTQT